MISQITYTGSIRKPINQVKNSFGSKEKDTDFIKKSSKLPLEGGKSQKFSSSTFELGFNDEFGITL